MTPEDETSGLKAPKPVIGPKPGTANLVTSGNKTLRGFFGRRAPGPRFGLRRDEASGLGVYG